MLKIRLQRVGRKNVPVFRLVLTDSKNSTKSGKFLEILGSYNPVSKEKQIKTDRVKYWLSKGAQPSETLHNMFVNEKIIAGKKINVLPKKNPIVKEDPKKDEPTKEETKTDDTASASESAPSGENLKEEIKTEEASKNEESKEEEDKTSNVSKDDAPKIEKEQ